MSKSVYTEELQYRVKLVPSAVLTVVPVNLVNVQPTPATLDIWGRSADIRTMSDLATDV